MREIKFRYWCKIENKMYDKAYVEEHLSLAFMSELIKAAQERYIFQQYTGLKDKNGKEIYEGDILRVWQEDEHIPNRDSGGGIIDYDCKKGFSQIGKVGFTSCSFDYQTVRTLDGKHKEIHAPIDWLNNYEVIGNIYEHSHLLEGK